MKSAVAEAMRADTKGQAVVEYALVVGLVSAVIIVALAASASSWVSAITSLATDSIAALLAG